MANNPPGFFTDEAAVGVAADRILHTGKDEHGEFLPILFRSTGDYKLPVSIYEDVPFIAIFGRTELAVRLGTAFLGSLTILTTYLLAKQLFRRELPAVAAAAFLATLPWHIHYSRTGFGELVSFPLVLTFSLYLFLRGLEDKRLLYFAAIGFGLTFYTYRAAWIILPPLLLSLAILYHQELWSQRKTILNCAAILVFFALPIIRHVLSDTADRGSQVWIFNLKTGKSTLSLFWDFYKSYFARSFLFDKGDNGAVLRHYLPGHGVLYGFQAPLVLAGLAGLARGFSRSSLIVVILLLLYPLSGALSDLSPISSRTLLGSVVYAVIIACGLTLIIDVVRGLKLPYSEVAAGAVVAVVAAFAVTGLYSYLHSYYRDYPVLAAGYWGWQDGPQAIVQRFLAVQDRYDQLFMDGDFNAPEVFIPFYAGNKCKKCQIGATERYDPAKRQLFALRPNNIDATKFDYVVLDSLSYPSGETSFLFLEITRRR